MVELRTVDAMLVEGRYATRVVGHAYDALTPEERRRLAAGNPDSFLNVLRSTGDEPDADPFTLLEHNRAALQRLVADGRYRRQPPALYLYRLISGTHTQTAVVGDLAVRHVEAGGVRAHEQTRATKEEELARHLAHLRAQSSPVGLGYRAEPGVDGLVEAVAGAAPPTLDFVTVDGVRQQIWALTDPTVVTALQAAFAAVHATYIIDGHHRVAAAARVDGDGHFLAALIPDHELRLLPYHRIVAGPVPPDLPARLARLAERYDITVAVEAASPREATHFLLYADRRWIALRRRQPLGPLLAAAVADAELLGPLLDVHDVRHDPRLSFVPGDDDVGARAAAAADRGDGAALLLSPPTVHDVFEEADHGRALPPKSTWFEPKLRSGVFLVHR